MSAQGSLRAVRSGKERGIRVTCEATPHHFILTDEQLSYDTNFKMNPPLREGADRDALIEGLVDGSIDVIATDHAPHHADEKAVEFDAAPFGIVGLETAVPLVLDRLLHTGTLALSRIIELLAVNPARVLGLGRGRPDSRRAGRPHTPGTRRLGRCCQRHRFDRRVATRHLMVGAFAAPWRPR